MFPALFRGELAGQLARFGGQPAAGRFVRVVELLWRGALWRSHNELNLPLPAGDVNKSMASVSSTKFSASLKSALHIAPAARLREFCLYDSALGSIFTAKNANSSAHQKRSKVIPRLSSNDDRSSLGIVQWQHCEQSKQPSDAGSVRCKGNCANWSVWSNSKPSSRQSNRRGCRRNYETKPTIHLAVNTDVHAGWREDFFTLPQPLLTFQLVQTAV